MPLAKPEDFGTGPDGYRINDYCHYCFENGPFTEPNITMKDMINKCINIMVKQGIMPEHQARSLMKDTIPKLKRWKGSSIK
jgi:hypothetical protein